MLGLLETHIVVIKLITNFNIFYFSHKYVQFTWWNHRMTCPAVPHYITNMIKVGTFGDIKAKVGTFSVTKCWALYDWSLHRARVLRVHTGP